MFDMFDPRKRLKETDIKKTAKICEIPELELRQW